MDDLDRLALLAAREVMQTDVNELHDEDLRSTHQAARQVLAMFEQSTARHSEP